MATTFAKLKLQKSSETTTVKFNDEIITVKRALPIKEKMELVSRIVTQVLANGTDFINPISKEVFTTLECIYTFSDLKFTEKQKEDIEKTFDLIHDNELDVKILSAVGDAFYDIRQWVDETLEEYFKYKNSATGVLQAMSTEYNDLPDKAKEVMDEIRNGGENLETVKEVVTKLY